MIGTFGTIVFYASSEALNTFNSFSRSEQGRWAKHEIVAQKPKQEFLGPDTGTVSFNMRFDVFYGMNPRQELDKLVTMVRDGSYYTLIIGGKGLGVNKWALKSVSENWTRVDNQGNVLVAEVSVQLEEYL